MDDLLKSAFLNLFGDPIANQKGLAIRTLGSIFSVKHGFAFKSDYFVEEGKYVLLTPGNFREEGGFRDRGDRQKFYAGEIPKEYLLSKDDLVIAMTEQAPGLLGSPLLVPATGRFLHNQRLGLIELKEPAQKPYLFHVFNHHSIRQVIHSRATGTKVRHTSPTKIEAITIGYPDFEQQKLFAGLCHSCEKIERTYRESLVELQFLFNTLSQNAFKDVLDLSRVILPAGFNSLAGDDTDDSMIEPIEQAPFELPTPPMPSLEDAYRARELALNQWLEAYVNHLRDEPFSADDFLNLVKQKLSAMEEDLDAEWVSELVGANDYEQVKAWVFKNLKGKKLRQKYDDKKNRIRVSTTKE